MEIKWIVTVGAIFALCTNLLGAMFPLPRVLYAMASDGIIYKNLKKINSRTKTPLTATILSGILSAIMALLFNLHQLIDMMSIGTLIAYTIVSICVLVLRYECDPNILEMQAPTIWEYAGQLINWKSIKTTNQLSGRIAKFSIIAFSICSILFCVCMEFLHFDSRDSIFLITALCLVTVLLVIFVVIIARQPILDDNLTFKVPFVPWIPCVSVLINLYLMFQLDVQTWIRFVVWAAIG